MNLKEILALKPEERSQSQIQRIKNYNLRREMAHIPILPQASTSTLIRVSTINTAYAIDIPENTQFFRLTAVATGTNVPVCFYTFNNFSGTLTAADGGLTDGVSLCFDRLIMLNGQRTMFVGLGVTGWISIDFYSLGN